MGGIEISQVVVFAIDGFLLALYRFPLDLFLLLGLPLRLGVSLSQVAAHSRGLRGVRTHPSAHGTLGSAHAVLVVGLPGFLVAGFELMGEEGVLGDAAFLGGSRLLVDGGRPLLTVVEELCGLHDGVAQDLVELLAGGKSTDPALLAC